MKNSIIRSFKKGDKEKVLELLKEVKLSTSDLTEEKLANFLIMEDKQGTIIGTIGVENYGELGLLRSLAVHPSYQGEGLGKELTKELEVLVRQRGIKSLFLLTTTAEDFFKKSGYKLIDRGEVPKIIKETEEFKNICPSSAVCLFKEFY